MPIKNKDLKKRILNLSYTHKLSHLGSCLTACDIIEEIYSTKKPDEKFILSAGHAGLALYVVLEKYYNFREVTCIPGGVRRRNAEDIFNHHGVHPDRCSDCGLDCSTGSLGQGLPIAVGMALADRSKNVYCLISDGECAEGSIWEALEVKDAQKLDNLKIYLNDNGYGAYRETSGSRLLSHIQEYGVERRYTNTSEFPFLNGLDAHYITLTEDTYKQAMEILK